MQGGPTAWGEQLDPVGKLNCKHIVEGPEGHSNQFVIGAWLKILWERNL